MILIIGIPIVLLATWICWKMFDSLFKEGRRDRYKMWNPESTTGEK